MSPISRQSRRDDVKVQEPIVRDPQRRYAIQKSGGFQNFVLAGGRRGFSDTTRTVLEESLPEGGNEIDEKDS